MSLLTKFTMAAPLWLTTTMSVRLFAFSNFAKTTFTILDEDTIKNKRC